MCQHLQQAGPLDAIDDDKQAHEEKDRYPLHPGKYLLELPALVTGTAVQAGNQQEQGGAEHGDGGGLLADIMREDETGDNQRQHQQGLPQQAAVGDGVGLVVVHHALACIGACLQVTSPDQVDGQQHGGQEQGDNRPEIEQEVVEAQPDGRADHDVGRVTDQRGGPADIGRENLGKQVGVGLHIQRVGDKQRDRRDQQHGRDIVQQGRQHGCYQRQHDQDSPRACLDLLGRPDGQELEDARLARDGHDDHHAGQQADGVEVDALQRRLLGQHTTQHHESRGYHGDDGAVDAFAHDEQVGQAEQHACIPAGIQSEYDIHDFRAVGHGSDLRL